MTASPEQATEAPFRFAKDEPVTILVTPATADAQYEACAPGGTTVGMLEALLPSKSPARIAVPCDGFPGVRVIHGDIMPTLVQALRDGMEYRDCTSNPECEGWRNQYEALLEALGEPPAT